MTTMSTICAASSIDASQLPHAQASEHRLASQQQPFWLSQPCPPWCEERYTGRDFDDDRMHAHNSIPQLPLNLYNGQAVTIGDLRTWHPPAVLLTAEQGYRAAEPDVVMVVPNLRERPDEYGETAVRMTTDEARTLRDRLTSLLSALGGGDSVPQLKVLPYWQTEPCPAWCEIIHKEDDYYDDRSHWYSGEDQPIDLSLHDPWRTPRIPAAENATGHDIPAGSGPYSLDVGARQHYRAAMPEILISVPQFEPSGRGQPEKEMDVYLTVAEARELRDGLSALLDALDAPTLPLPQRPVLVQVDKHIREGEPHSVTIGRPGYEQATIRTNLQQWTEPGSAPDVEVLADIASTPMGLSPRVARAEARKLHFIADRITELADQAEAFNTGLGRPGRPALSVASTARNANTPIVA